LIDENIPPEELLSIYFKDKNINLIVVGKGENFKAWMLGSTAPIIARYADCSFTIIK
jgi:nucleotide-binding universal stress UspA family protein